MITRQDYLNSDCQKTAHRAYYAQFVTQNTLDLVERTFSKACLKKSEDPHFNDISLRRWDAKAYYAITKPIEKKLRELGDYPTLAGAVCILKEAAQQIRESK